MPRVPDDVDRLQQVQPGLCDRVILAINPDRTGGLVDEPVLETLVGEVALAR